MIVCHYNFSGQKIAQQAVRRYLSGTELLRSGDELHVAACSVRSLELAPLLLVDLALVLVRVLCWR